MPDASAPPSSGTERDRGLEGADLDVAHALAAARTALLQRSGEAHARQLRRLAARRRDERRRTDEASSAPVTARVAAASESRTVTVGLLPLAAAVLAIALVAGALGGLTVLGVSGQFGRDGTAQAPNAVAPNPSIEAAGAATVLPSVVSLHLQGAGRTEVGSALVLHADGLILTNAHVVTMGGATGTPSITATAADGRVYEATVVGIDPLADLAVLRLEGATDLMPVTWGDSSTLTAGAPVVVAGSPLGLGGSMSSGVVSSVHRSIQIPAAAPSPTADVNSDPSTGTGLTTPPGDTVYLAVFQTDAAINPGSSGGPVVNDAGEVVGVAVAIATTRGGAGAPADGSIGLGFAIPSTVAQRIAAQLVAGAVPSHGALGATFSQSASTTGGTRVGAAIDAVTSGAAADRAGLRRGDIVTAIAGVPVQSPSDLLAWVRAHPGGAPLELECLRDGKPLTLRVTLDTAA